MPSTANHSRSLSLSSTKSSNDGIKKKFCCTFPACGKSFSRSEHLHRHALNHKDGNNTCLRCSAHFRRRDLLDRHMARHKEKDDEAGGEGLGVLATRKRLWRDADGNIVNARRPSYTPEGAKRRQIARPDRQHSQSTGLEGSKPVPGQLYVQTSLPSPTTMSRSGSSTIIVDSRLENARARREGEEELRESQDAWLELNAHTLPSPPRTAESHRSGARSPSAPLGELDALYEETWSPLTHDGLPQLSSSAGSGSQTPSLTSSSHPSPFFGTPNWGPSLAVHPATQPFQTFMGAMSEAPYEDAFKAEAGMYDWQGWNQQVLMSRCREEKYDPLEERKVEWAPMYPAPDSFGRPFGMGTV